MVRDYSIYDGKQCEAYKMIDEAKQGGCVCCGMSNPCEIGNKKLGYFAFHNDHVDNRKKSEWFKIAKYFSPRAPGFQYGEALKKELALCQCLCAACHAVKGYIENEERHTLTKHKLLYQYYPEVVKWYIAKYSNCYDESNNKDDYMLNHLTSPRSKTDEFVFIDNDQDYRRYGPPTAHLAIGAAIQVTPTPVPRTLYTRWSTKTKSKPTIPLPPPSITNESSTVVASNEISTTIPSMTIELLDESEAVQEPEAIVVNDSNVVNNTPSKRKSDNKSTIVVQPSKNKKIKR